MQPGNKDNIVNISKFKHKQDPLNSYTMSLIDKGLPIDTTELSAQSVNWVKKSIPEIKESQLIPYKSLIRKIFDWLNKLRLWFMVKGL